MGEYSKLFFYTSSLSPKVQTLAFSYTWFDRKGKPFVYLQFNMDPFYIPKEGTLHLFLHLDNTERSAGLLEMIWKVFLNSQMIVFPFFYTPTCEILTLLYTYSLKNVPISGGASRIVNFWKNYGSSVLVIFLSHGLKYIVLADNRVAK